MLQILDHGPIREIRLDRPPANALSDELICELRRAVAAAGREADAIVVSGRPGMFSAGLDVPSLIDLDRTQFRLVWQHFLEVQQEIANAPVPVAFALTGHAPAGGIVISLFGDFRVMPEGRYKTGVNEVQVGLVLPRSAFLALVRLVGAHQAERLAVSGDMIEARQALEIGLVDELAADPEAVVTRAIAWCEQHLSLPRRPMLATRAMARASLRSVCDGDPEAEIATFLDFWFEDDTQRTLCALVDRLKGK